MTIRTKCWALIRYNTLASHTPGSAWLLDLAADGSPHMDHSRGTHSIETRHHLPPFFRPNQAAECAGRLFKFKLLLEIQLLPLLIAFLLLLTYSLPIPPPLPPSFPNSITLGLLNLSGWKFGSVLKEQPVLAPRSWDFSNFMLRQLFPWTYRAETSQSHPLRHTNQGRTHPHCSRFHPGKHNVTRSLMLVFMEYLQDHF